ncbi:MAG: heavy metal sensor histidine kinase [Planctomycetes bacterium]|nr:heavy metal sensor histidine kinase [Planctomycetota bacterium]
MSSEASDRRQTRLSIGTRLTLWSTATTLLACGLLCILLYIGFRDSLYREIDGFLDGEVRELSSIVVEDFEEDGGLSELEQEVRRELGSRLKRDLIFRLFDEKGRRLMTSDPADPLPETWHDERIWRRKSGETIVDDYVVVPTRENFRVTTTWLSPSAGQKVIVQSAYRMDEIERSLGTFWRVSLTAMLIVGLTSIAGGRIVARRCLTPVERITACAERIGHARIDERVPLSGNGDELDRLSRTLNDMLDRIEDQMRRMQQFTADASHELRTPLTAMLGAAEVALSKPRSVDELRSILQENVEHYSRLARIADDLLLLARADAGKLTLELSPIRLHELLAEIVELYTPIAEERGIAISIIESAPVTLCLDSQRMRQVMVNLLDNAFKYIGTGRRIDLKLARLGDSIRIDVQDDGPGISPERLPHVFDRFYRADQARTRGAGAGLGLAICRSVIEAHKGRIQVECHNGTIVTIFLPPDSEVTAPQPPRILF